jgi:predicted HD phosphohydrolase
LELQGGILNPKECAKFEAQEYFKPSILLRKFDEAAKKTDIKMKSIHDYEKLLSSKLI